MADWEKVKLQIEGLINSAGETTGKNITNLTDGINELISGYGKGASDDLRYVTFMSHDGTIEYGKKAVAVGDDCADPIARGIFETPTRESDVQYDYTHDGWSDEIGGSVNADWNKFITEDKTVYATYSKSLRKYTVSFYDEDTLLKTEQVTYGGSSSYIPPTKDGYFFDTWNPLPTNITSDLSCYAQYKTDVDFATASWADIANVAKNGEAETYFAIGDTKKITFNGETLDVVIVGFNHDDLSDGSGKAPISIVCKHVSNFSTAFSNNINGTYKSSLVKTKLNDDIWVRLPSDLRNVIKYVDKEYDTSYSSGSTSKGTISERVWAPSLHELGSVANTRYPSVGTRYPYYSQLTTEKVPTGYLSDGKTRASYWLPRNLLHVGVNAIPYYNSGSNTLSTMQNTNISSKSINILFGFCI